MVQIARFESFGKLRSGKNQTGFNNRSKPILPRYGGGISRELGSSSNSMAKKILFIEDEAVMQKAVSDFLTTRGYEIMSSLDGELGLISAKTRQPDLILLDLILPKKNGFEVLKELKADPATKSIPVVVLTNLSEMGDIGKVLEYGVTTYLVKSDQSLNDIHSVVEKILGPQS